MRPTVFVSYSRTDLPFVMWGVNKLRPHGISCWVDVEQLAPSADWARAIAAAQDECPALLLVASNESLGSSYCRHEWTRAIDDGKRIVVAVIEPVRLPPELSACATVDMRAWDGPSWVDLARALDGGTVATPAQPGRLRIPKPMALAGTALAVLLVMQVVLAAEWAVAAAPVFPGAAPVLKALIAGHLAVLAALIAWTTRWSWRFVQRGGTQLGLFGMIALPWAWMVHGIVSTSSMWFTGLIVSAAMYGIVFLAPEIGAWVPVRKRRSLSAPAAGIFTVTQADRPPRPIVPSGTRMYFGLYHAPGDERVAARLDELMEAAGHLRVARAEIEDVRLLVLSNATPADFEPLAQARASGVPSVCVVLTALAVADDREAFHWHQWVEYRSRDDLQIERLARWLREGSSGNVGAVLPEVTSLGKMILPPAASVISLVMTILAALMMFAAALPALEGRLPAAELAGAASGVVAALTAAVVRGRLVTFPAYACGFVAAFGLLVVYAVAQGAHSGVYSTVLALAVAFGLPSMTSLRDWLLSRSFAWRSPTLAAERSWPLVGRQLMIPLVAGVAVAMIYASCEAVRVAAR